MSYLSKNDEKRFIYLLQESEVIVESVVENLLNIRSKKTEFMEMVEKQKREIFESLEGHPSLMDELSPNISVLKGKGICFDAIVFLIKLAWAYSDGTTMKGKLDHNRFMDFGMLYYNGYNECFIEEMTNLFREIKVRISDVINNNTNLITINMSEKDIEQLIQNRKSVNWIIRNMGRIVETYTCPIKEEIIDYFNQDRLLLLLSHFSISTIIEDIKKNRKISEDNVKFCKTYVAYVNYRRKKDPNYNPSYNYPSMGTGKRTHISAETILIQNKEFGKSLKAYGGETCIAEEELLDFLPDLKRELQINKFRKEIELSWEFLPEKQSGDAQEKRMPLFKRYKTDEEKKELEDKKDDLLEEKIELFSSLPYVTSLKGMNRFEGYVAYIFENGRVVLEKFYKKTKHGLEPTYNEAIYVMNISDFQELSKMGKTEIRQYAKDVGLKVRVIHHTKNFKQRVMNEVTSIGYTDDVMNFVEELVSNAKTPLEKTL